MVSAAETDWRWGWGEITEFDDRKEEGPYTEGPCVRSEISG